MDEPSLEVSSLDEAERRSNISLPAQTLRRRMWRIGVVTLTLVAMAAFLMSKRTLSSLRWSLPVRVERAPNVPTHTVTLWHSVPWGQLTIDGKPFAVNESSTIQVAEGHHSLRYAAPPFLLLSCDFSVPAHLSDTCHPLTAQPGEVYPYVETQTLDLGASPQALPLPQQAALATAIQRALDANAVNTSVFPGDHYARSAVGLNGQPVVASQNVPTTVRSVLLPGALHTSGCIGLCADPSAWELEVTVLPQWTFTVGDSTLIVPISPTESRSYESAHLNISVIWDGWWSASVPLHQLSPVCQVAQARAQLVAKQSGSSLQVGSVADPFGAGITCILHMQAPEGAIQSSPSPILLFHGGVLIAGNEVAHRTFASLPLGSPNEQRTAQAFTT